ncbi:MAG TPA: hypothetical protein VN327_00270 [Pseudonocardiaceae bacterium]|nr:hypothetical protein [Pseudonocardiaceae bacterium]
MPHRDAHIGRSDRVGGGVVQSVVDRDSDQAALRDSRPVADEQGPVPRRWAQINGHRAAVRKDDDRTPS